MDLARTFESKWVRLGVSALLATALWWVAVYGMYWASWGESSALIDAFTYAVVYLLPGLACAVVAWYSRTIWSVGLPLLAALAMRDVIAPCIHEPDQGTWMCTPGTASASAQLAVMLPILFGWSAGYWLARRRAT